MQVQTDNVLETLVQQLKSQIIDELRKQLRKEFEASYAARAEQRTRYMTQKECYSYLNISVHTLNKFVDRGLAVVQVADDTRSLYDINDVDNFMNSRKICKKAC